MGLLSNNLVRRFLSTIPLPLPSMVHSHFLLVHQSWVATDASGSPTSWLPSFRHRNFVRKDLDWKGHDLDPSSPQPYRECTPCPLGILPPFSPFDLLPPSFLGRGAGSHPLEGRGEGFWGSFFPGIDSPFRSHRRCCSKHVSTCLVARVRRRRIRTRTSTKESSIARPKKRANETREPRPSFDVDGNASETSNEAWETHHQANEQRHVLQRTWSSSRTTDERWMRKHFT